MTEILPFDAARDDGDLYDLFEAVVAAGEGFPQAAPLTRPEYEAQWRKEGTSVFVARDDDQGLLGAYYLKPNQPGRAAHIANAGYVVSSAVRGQGLGRRLVQHSIETAPGLGFDAIQFNLVFESNPARPMYEELGWREIGRVPNAVEGEPAVIYWRDV